MNLLDREWYRGGLRQHKSASRLDRQWRVCRVVFWATVAGFASLLVASVWHRL